MVRADEIEFLIEKRNRYINDLILFPRYDGENFHAVNDKSQFSHGGEQLGIYRGKAFVTSCGYYSSSCNRKTELLDMTTLTWSNGADFPQNFSQ